MYLGYEENFLCFVLIIEKKPFNNNESYFADMIW